MSSAACSGQVRMRSSSTAHLEGSPSTCRQGRSGARPERRSSIQPQLPTIRGLLVRGPFVRRAKCSERTAAGRAQRNAFSGPEGFHTTCRKYFMAHSRGIQGLRSNVRTCVRTERLTPPLCEPTVTFFLTPLSPGVRTFCLTPPTMSRLNAV